MKKTHDYDSAFQSLKSRHKRLFIAVINEAFGKHYPLDSRVTILPAKNTFHSPEGSDSQKNIEERENDSLLCICGDYYLLECQSYDDETMSLRLAEYTFLAARSISQNEGNFDQGYILLPMPHFTVIYIKNSSKTPRTTTIAYQFPDGQTHEYSSYNVFLSEITKEEIIAKKLFVYIPFYIARYEKELKTEKDYEKAIKDLEYFRDEMLKSRKENQLDDFEMDDLRDCVNDIVIHITDGNKIESEVTSVMGGEIYELHSDRIIREATEPLIQQLADKDKEISEAESRANKAESRADEAESRASMLEQELEKQRKKLQMLEEKLREADGK